MTDTTVVEETADRLRNLLDKDDLLDVGKGAADILGIKPTKFVRALEQLKDEGYQIWYLLLQRKDANLQTTIKVLTKGNMRFVDVMARRDDIKKVSK